MSHSSHRSPRALATRLALIGAVGLGSLVPATPALASAAASVAVHVHNADIALQRVGSAGASGGGSASASGQFNASLAGLTAELGSAAKISAELGVQSSTPKLQAAAVRALTLVAAEEAKATSTLNAVTFKVSGTTRLAVDKANLEVVQGRELALNALAHLGVHATAKAHPITDEVAMLSSHATRLLTGLATGFMPHLQLCPLSGSLSGVISTRAASEQAHFAVGVPIPLIGDVLNAGGWLLNTVTTDEVAQILSQVQGVVGCGDNPPQGVAARDHARVHDGLIPGIVGGLTGSIGAIGGGIGDNLGDVAGSFLGSGEDSGLLSVLTRLSL